MFMLPSSIHCLVINYIYAAGASVGVIFYSIPWEYISITFTIPMLMNDKNEDLFMFIHNNAGRTGLIPTQPNNPC